MFVWYGCVVCVCVCGACVWCVCDVCVCVVGVSVCVLCVCVCVCVWCVCVCVMAALLFARCETKVSVLVPYKNVILALIRDWCFPPINPGPLAFTY